MTWHRATPNDSKTDLSLAPSQDFAGGMQMRIHSVARDSSSREQHVLPALLKVLQKNSLKYHCVRV